MARLIEDAAKLSDTVDAQDMSFANIVKAINVVQTEMGITGTTAKEAASTIQGSVGMMKSSWTNLVTGIADENANLDVLIANFVDSVGTVAQNIVPKIGVALNSASKLISDLIPVIVQEIPVLIEENLPILAEAAISIIQSLVNGISENQEILMTTAMETITYLATSLISMLPQIVQLGLDLIVSLANGIAESLPELIPTIVDVVLQIVDTLTNPDSVSKLLVAAAKIIGAVAIGLIEAVPDLIIKIPEIVSSIVNGFSNAMPDIVSIGKDIVKGVWKGISGMIKWFTDKVKGFFSGIVDGVKDTLGIHSPSKVFAGIGGFMAEGLADGWDKEYNGIKRSIEKDLNFGTATVDFDSSALSKKHSGIEGAFSGIANSAGENITIVVQSVLNGKVIGETSYRYSQDLERAYGGA